MRDRPLVAVARDGFLEAETGRTTSSPKLPCTGEVREKAGKWWKLSNISTAMGNSASLVGR